MPAANITVTMAHRYSSSSSSSTSRTSNSDRNGAPMDQNHNDVRYKNPSPPEDAKVRELWKRNKVGEEEGEEDISVFLFKPPKTSSSTTVMGINDEAIQMDDGERARRTKTFLHLVLNTRDEQLWKDLLTSALRLQTLRPHHLEQLIRGVTAVFDSSAKVKDVEEEEEERERDNEEESAKRRGRHGETAEEDEDAVVGGGPFGSMSSSLSRIPTRRLERVVAAIQFVHEHELEQWAALDHHHPPDDDASNRHTDELENRSFVPSLLTQRVLIQLLVHLCRGAENTLEMLSSSSSSSSSSSATSHVYYYSNVDLWRFLAWMERHDLHIGSEKIIDSLEEAVESDYQEQQLRDIATVVPSAARSGHQKEGKTSTSTTATTTLLLRQTNRLQYLHREKVWCRRYQAMGARSSRSNGKGLSSLLHEIPEPPPIRRAPESQKEF